MSTAPRSRRGFKVAIFCALPLEAEAVQSILDTCWEDLDKEYGKEVGDQNTYTTGVIGKHNVVLVHMPSMGIASAGLSAAGLRSSFPGVQLALVVGICGVVPIHTQTQEEIVLGDVIISTAVIQYDFGRQFPNEFKRKSAIEDSLGRANPEIRGFLNRLQTRPTRRRWITKLAELARSSSFQKQARTAEYPGASLDRLFEASYTHQHRPHMDCDRCHDNHEVCSQSCDALGCEEGKTIIRNRHVFPQAEDLASLPFGTPFVHLGRFGSANTVMKSGMDRDRLAATDEIIAFEMEGAGVWEQYPSVVIKAACDYADSHKNKKWQSYAAATAAACLKVFLNEWVIPDSPADQEEVSKPLWHVPFNKMSGFVGRSDELHAVKAKLFDRDDCPIISLLGLGGVGKSRSALELAHQTKSEYPQYSVFWVQAEKLLTFEEDMLHIGKKLGIPGIDDPKADVKTLVKQRLQNSPEEKWFLILNNADDEMLWGRRSNPSQQELSLVDYLPRTPNGSILVTTRSRHVATFLAENEVVHLDALSPAEAAEMFTYRTGSRGPSADQNALQTLLEKLTNLPLAIIQASSFIKRTQCSVHTYLELLDQPEEAVIQLLSKDFGDQTRYPHALNPIAFTWLISFRHIREHHPLAAAFLSSIACLHEKAIPFSLLPKADSKIDTIEAIGVLTGYSFAEKRTCSDIISDVEELYDVHRLVQLAARNWMEGRLVDEIKACTVRLAELFPTRNHEYKSIWSMYLPHGQRLCEKEGDFPERYRLLEKMGLCLLVDGKYDDAVKAHTLVVDWRAEKLGISNEQTLRAYNNLGEALN